MPENAKTKEISASCDLNFFVGTTAELIKLLPIMAALKASNTPFEVIASGQNNIADSELLKMVFPAVRLKILSSGPTRPSAPSLFFWFLKTLLPNLFGHSFRTKKNLDHSVKMSKKMIVHGDTISTLMGALLARSNGYVLCHVEAGLRSFNLLRPFPEEICRVIVSHLAQESYCPNEWAVKNLHGQGGMKIYDTRENTLVDSLQLALMHAPTAEVFTKLPPRFFLFVIHRQENLFDTEFVKKTVDLVIEQSRTIPAIMILHEPTRVVLEKLDLMDKLLAAKIMLLPRMPYIDFTHLLSRCEFILTDGGSNQEECYYLGIPCLILRSETERIEGLNHNAVLSGKNLAVIKEFLSQWEKYRKPPIVPNERPSQIIAHELKSTGETHP